MIEKVLLVTNDFFTYKGRIYEPFVEYQVSQEVYDAVTDKTRRIAQAKAKDQKLVEERRELVSPGTTVVSNGIPVEVVEQLLKDTEERVKAELAVEKMSTEPAKEIAEKSEESTTFQQISGGISHGRRPGIGTTSSKKLSLKTQ